MYPQIDVKKLREEVREEITKLKVCEVCLPKMVIREGISFISQTNRIWTAFSCLMVYCRGSAQPFCGFFVGSTDTARRRHCQLILDVRVQELRKWDGELAHSAVRKSI